jgi:hypothetical protein
MMFKEVLRQSVVAKAVEMMFKKVLRQSVVAKAIGAESINNLQILPRTAVFADIIITFSFKLRFIPASALPVSRKSAVKLSDCFSYHGFKHGIFHGPTSCLLVK